jgi:hypothetical protein
VYNNESYFVDVVFNPTMVVPPTTSASPSPTTTAEPTTTAPPTSEPPVTTEPTTTAPTTTTTTNPGGSILDLPRIPWEGGPSYYAQFPDAQRWTDPGFFPIAIWYNGISDDSEAQYDKAHGINTYMGMDPNTDFSLFERNNLYWMGGPLRNAAPHSPNWPGNLLDDEVDGRFTPEAGRAHLQGLIDGYAGNGKFNYANWTQIIMSNDGSQADHQAYVNMPGIDTQSIDMYWYTIPFCSLTPYRSNYVVPVEQSSCRTASSYGKTVKMLRQQDATDGHLKPAWQFVELHSGGPAEGQNNPMITPDQLKGAVMSSVINEARGIVWFNSTFSGPCAGATLRVAQLQEEGRINGNCAVPNADAAKAVNTQIQRLAPVINTQSYQWSFGSGLDTMLKVKDGSAYVFAMAKDGGTGPRTFTLPAGVSGSSVEVVDEGRTLPVSGGSFTDSFAAENSYHIYRVVL